MSYTKRLIDADALKEQIENEIHTYWTNGTGGYCLAEDVIPDIDNAPTVDAVEVVRCKDCKHFSPNIDVKVNRGVCEHNAMTCWLEKYDDDFCSYGERRSE